MKGKRQSRRRARPQRLGPPTGDERTLGGRKIVDEMSDVVQSDTPDSHHVGHRRRTLGVIDYEFHHHIAPLPIRRGVVER